MLINTATLDNPNCLPHSADDNTAQAKPNFVVYRHEVTDGYTHCEMGLKVIAALGKLWDVYLVDTATAVHSCSLTGAFEGRFLYNTWENGQEASGLSEVDYEIMTERVMMKDRPDSEYSYFDCRSIEAAIEKGVNAVPKTSHDEGEEYYAGICEKTWEHERCNPTF